MKENRSFFGGISWVYEESEQIKLEDFAILGKMWTIYNARTKVLDRRSAEWYHMPSYLYILYYIVNAFEQKLVHTEIPLESCRVVQDNRESCVEFLLQAVHRMKRNLLVGCNGCSRYRTGVC